MGHDFLEDPDVRLMLDVQAERPGAFEELVTRHSAPLVNFLFRHAGSQEDAEDLAQEVFAKVYRARGGYAPSARFRTWLLTIATNLCLNRKRYEAYRFHWSLDAPPGDDPAQAAPEVEDGRDDGPVAGVESAEIAERVRRAVGRLPENQRVAVNLLRFEGLAYRDIAGAMQISVQAVKSLLNRAKENLRSMLARDVKDYLNGRGAPVAGDL